MYYRVKKKVELVLLILIGLLFIYRTATPEFKYVFLYIYIPFSFYIIYNYRLTLKKDLKRFLVHYVLAFAVLTILICAFVISNKVYVIIFKDLINIIIIFSIFFIYNIIIKSKQELIYFIENFIFISIILAGLISLVVLSKLGIPRNNITTDYNFALLPIFIGFCSISFGEKYIKTYKLGKATILYVLLLLFTINILQSGSRRGMFILIIIICIMIFQELFDLFKKKSNSLNHRSIRRYYLSTLLLFVTFIYLFIFHTNYQTKNSFLEIVGFKDPHYVKHNISHSIYRYVSSYKKDLKFKEFHNKIWTHAFDPKNPRSGWGSQIHEKVYPLHGENVELVPEGTIGYLLDSATESRSWDNNAYSTTLVFKHNVERDLKYKASVYCYVSSEFNGNFARIYVRGSVRGNTAKNYDLKKKGSWQRLDVNYNGKGGEATVYLRFSKYCVDNFSTLDGYVIFAYPTYRSVPRSVNAKTHTNHSVLGTKLHRVNDYFTSSKIRENKYYQEASVFHFMSLLPQSLIISSKFYSNSIGKKGKNIFMEDTTYYGYSADINFSHDPKNAIHSRTDRWRFAWKLYTKEYNLKHKIIGHGFDYLNWYGYYFYNDETRSDWPHNPFLSVLLYSGVIGLSLYILLLYKVISIYLRYVKEYYILFVFWGIAFFFSFFSANNPLNPPIMGFFMMLPFFIDYIHKKDNSNKSADQLN